MDTINNLLKDLNYKAELQGFDTSNAANWKVTINGKTFKYFEGIGNFIEQKYYNKLIAQEVIKVLSGEKKDWLASDYYKGVYKTDRIKKNKLTPPKIQDVMYCLVSDYFCAVDANSFEDFCANFGYDVDSIKALKTYKALQKNAIKIAGLGLDLKALQDAYSDY